MEKELTVSNRVQGSALTEASLGEALEMWKAGKAPVPDGMKEVQRLVTSPTYAARVALYESQGLSQIEAMIKAGPLPASSFWQTEVVGI